MKQLLRLPFFVFLFCLSAKLFSQNNSSVKVYAHLAVDGARGVPIIDKPGDDLLKFKWFSPALYIELDSGRYHEFELTNLKFQAAPTDDVDTRLSIGLKYERGKRFTKKQNGPSKIMGGISIRAYYGKEQLNQLNPNGQATENRILGLALGINPHVEFKLHKNLSFDFAPYCELLNLAARSELVFDEFLADEQRDSLDFYLLKLQGFLRFGLVWKY